MVEWAMEPMVPSVLADVTPRGWDSALRLEVVVPAVEAERYEEAVIRAEGEGGGPAPGSGRFTGTGALISAELRSVVECMIDHPHHLVEQVQRGIRSQIPSGWCASDIALRVRHVTVQRPEGTGRVEIHARVGVPWTDALLSVRLETREPAAC